MAARRSTAWRLGIVMGSALAVFVVASITAQAGEGNPNYLGILSSTTPTGYVPSPSFYDVGSGPSQLNFQFDVTNLTAEPQTMSLEVNLDHITKYLGQDVSDGQPGVVNGAVVDGVFDSAGATEIQDPTPTSLTLSIAASATETIHVSRQLPAATCGYYQVDLTKVGLESQKGLVGFEIRTLGCTSATPTPSPSAEGSPRSRPRPIRWPRRSRRSIASSIDGGSASSRA